MQPLYVTGQPCLHPSGTKGVIQPDAGGDSTYFPESRIFEMKCDEGHEFAADVGASLMWKCEAGKWIERSKCIRKKLNFSQQQN